MNEKDLFSAIGDIDEKFIAESAQTKTKIISLSFVKKAVGAVAVMAVLAIGIAYGIPSINHKGETVLKNDFGIVVKAESIQNSKAKDTELISDKDITIPNTNFKKMADEAEKNSITNLKEIIETVKNNPDFSFSDFKLNNLESCFKKDENGCLYEWKLKDDCLLSAKGDINISASAAQTFKINGENIKDVDIISDNSFSVVIDENEKGLSFAWIPFKDFVEYYCNKEETENDFSNLHGDELKVKITFENGTKTTKTIKLSWDKDGSLKANVK